MVLFDFNPADFTILGPEFQRNVQRYLYKAIDNAQDGGCWADVYLPAAESHPGQRPVGKLDPYGDLESPSEADLKLMNAQLYLSMAAAWPLAAQPTFPSHKRSTFWTVALLSFPSNIA
jgi:hypothetical protein